MLTSTTATNTYADWSSTSTYNQLDRVAYADRYWEAQQVTTAGEQPLFDQNYPWLQLGPANVNAMFDESPSSLTSGTSPLTVVVTPGAIDAAAFFSVTGTSLALTGVVGTSTTYSRTIDVAGISEAVALNIPANASMSLTISLTGTGTVSIGAAVFGTNNEIGTAQAGASAGIIDYSVKSTDDYGDTVLVQRGFAKTLSVEALIQNNQLNRVHRLISSLRATPTVWIASTATDYAAPGIVYGYYRDFSLDVRYPTYSVCSFEIEGLV